MEIASPILIADLETFAGGSFPSFSRKEFGMKTNNVMLRPMGQFNVEQRTKDGMFNATALLKQWNECNGTKKDINTFIEEENSFSLFFFGEYKPHMECSNGILWLCEPAFHNFMDFLSPELENELYDSCLFANRFPFVVKCKPAREVYTYVMTDESGLYKIGKTTDVSSRYASLSIGNPSLRLVCILKGDIESSLHSKYKKYRVCGEWFRLSKSHIREIRESANTHLTRQCESFHP